MSNISMSKKSAQYVCAIDDLVGKHTFLFFDNSFWGRILYAMGDGDNII